MKLWLIAWLPTFTTLAGLAVFVAMFPWHPTVDLDLVNYAAFWLGLLVPVAIASVAVWALTRSMPGWSQRPRRIAIAAVVVVWAAMAVASLAWFTDLAPYRIWDWLFSAPALLAATGMLAAASALVFHARQIDPVPPAPDVP